MAAAPSPGPPGAWPGAGGTRPRWVQAAGVATRPRGVLAISPARTRNGSATTSTVSASSPTTTASVESPTGPPPKRRTRAVSTARSSRSRPLSSTSYSSSAVLAAALLTTPSPRTSAKSLTRRSSRLAILGVPRERLAISSAPSSRRVTPSSPADRGERRDIERHGGRAGALAQHHVDPEVLHGQIEHLLGRPGEPVYLIDEHDLAAGQRGQHRREVAGPLDRRAAADPQRSAELGRDDHRDRRLAQPGRPGQQHVVRRLAPPQRSLEHQGELFAEPGLADELG